MALRHIYYLNMWDFNVIIGEVRWEHSHEDSSPLYFPHMNNFTKQHKMSLSELQLSDWATMGFKWLHFVLPEYKKPMITLMFHEYHLSFQNYPILLIFKNCRLLHHNDADDVEICICMRDAFMSVYSVFEVFTALHLKCNQRRREKSWVQWNGRNIASGWDWVPPKGVQSCRGKDSYVKKKRKLNKEITTLFCFTSNISKSQI